MPFEVTCSQCQGRLLVAEAGVVVACPHCGAHLSIPSPQTASAPPDLSVPAASAFETPTLPEIRLTPAAAPTPLPAAETGAFWNQAGSLAAGQPSATIIADSPAADAAHQTTPEFSFESETLTEAPVASTADFETLIEQSPVRPLFEVQDPSQFHVETLIEKSPLATGMAVMPDTTVTPVEISVEGQAAGAAEATPDVPVQGEVMPYLGEPAPTPSDMAMSSEPVVDPPSEPVSTTPVAETADSPGAFVSAPASQTLSPQVAPARSTPAGVSRGLFMIVASWASAMTLTCGFLLMKNSGPSRSDLESLPDVKPIKNKDGTIGTKIAGVASAMPAGHTLLLSEEQRFGNLVVTPVAVSRGSLDFVHHLEESNQRGKPQPVSDVLKLWLRFRNVSTDQYIAPLDDLVFRRHQKDLDSPVQANNFLCRLSEKKQDGHRVFVFDLNENDVWNLKGQNPGYEIPPGGELLTFVPAAREGLEQVLGTDEELVWRVHFRKGYSPKQYGVTTLIEVRFRESDISGTDPARLTSPPAASSPASEV